MSANLNVIQSHADVQGAYLTALLEYMEKYQMIKSGRVDETRIKALEKLTLVRTVFEDAIEQCKKIAALCHVSLDDDGIGGSFMFLPGTKIYLHDDTTGFLITLNDHPDRLNTPFTFIDSLSICEEVLYGSSKYYAGELAADRTQEENADDN